MKFKLSKLKFKLNYLVIAVITIAFFIVGDFLSASGLNWYMRIRLPSWTPPASFIGLLWVVIYILAAFSALIVYNSGKGHRDLLIIIELFILNGFLNIFWTFLFFNLHLLGFAVWEAIILDICIIAMIFFIKPISRKAAVLLIPYLGWVTFATFLAYEVWKIN